MKGLKTYLIYVGQDQSPLEGNTVERAKTLAGIREV